MVLLVVLLVVRWTVRMLLAVAMPRVVVPCQATSAPPPMVVCLCVRLPPSLVVIARSVAEVTRDAVLGHQ